MAKAPKIEQPAERRKHICIRDCYLKHETDIPVHYYRGMIAMFAVTPDHFAPVDGVLDTAAAPPKPPVASGIQNFATGFDYDSAPEELLLAADYNVEDLVAYSATHYGIGIPIDPVKAVMVAKFVDARYKHYQTKNALNAAELKALG